MPVDPLGTTKYYFVRKQGIDVNVFGMINEGNSAQHTMILEEDAKRVYNSAAS